MARVPGDGWASGAARCGIVRISRDCRRGTAGIGGGMSGAPIAYCHAADRSIGARFHINEVLP